MRVLAIVHQADAGLGVFHDSLNRAAAGVDTWRPDRDAAPDRPEAYDAVIVLGGAAHPDQDGERAYLGTERAVLTRLLAAGVPVLGVCLGAQLLAQAAGGAARRARTPEIGFTAVALTPAAGADPVMGALPAHFDALAWHSYECVLPPGATALAQSGACLHAFRIGATGWGIQFHAEVTGEDFGSWVSDYRSDPDAVAIGVDPDGLRSAAEERIAAWNELGRGLCDRFLAVAAARGQRAA